MFSTPRLFESFVAFDGLITILRANQASYPIVIDSRINLLDVELPYPDEANACWKLSPFFSFLFWRIAFKVRSNH